MFYSFYAERKKTSLGRMVGSWNLDRFWTKNARILKDVGILQGEWLEIGPGEGIFARKCREADVKYRAVDRSPLFCRRLRDEGFDVVQASVPPLPYKNEQFDAVCAFEVLEHMPTFEHGLGLLHECHRVLKPTGWLVVEVPDYIRSGIDFLNWDYTHSFFMTPLRVQQILGDTGFQVHRVQHFTGSITAPLLRWPADLVGFAVHSRFVYWLGQTLGFVGLLESFHRTFQSNILVVSQKISPETATGSRAGSSES